MALKLEPVFTLRAYIGEGRRLGIVKGGNTRSIAPVTGGYLRGSGIDAEVLGGADYPLVRLPS